MQIETLKDVLEWTAGFHRQLSGCLARCESHEASERGRLLLDYLKQHEATLAKLVETFEREASSNALNTWCYEYLDKNPIMQQPCREQVSDLPDVNAVLGSVLKQHNQLIDLYRYLYAEAAVVPSAKELLQELIDLEQHEIMRMVQSSNRLSDL